MATSSARRLSRRTTASTTSMPPLGLASACASSARSVTRQCGVRVAAHSAPRSTPCGVPKSFSKVAAYSGAALLQGREDRAAVVVGHHDRQVGARLVGPDHQGGQVVQEGHVADVGDRPGAVRAGRARRRSRSTGCRRCPARPRLASTIRRSPTGWAPAIRSRSRIGLLAPTTSSPPGGLAASTTRATSYGVRPGCSATKASMRADSVRSAARHSSSQAVSVGSATETAACSAVDGERPVGPATAGPAPRPPRRRRAPAAAAPAGTAWGGRRPRPARPAAPRSVPSSSR